MGSKLYYPTHTRFTPWMIGIGLGYILHVTKKQPIIWSRNTVRAGWVVSSMIMIFSLTLVYRFMLPGYKYERFITALYVGTFRQVWSLAIAWQTFCLVRGYGGVMASFFSRHVFLVIGRLSFCVYLIHYILMFEFFKSTTAPQFIKASTVVSSYFVTVFYSLLTAVFLHLVVEAPPIYIEKILLRKKKTK